MPGVDRMLINLLEIDLDASITVQDDDGFRVKMVVLMWLMVGSSKMSRNAWRKEKRKF